MEAPLVRCPGHFRTPDPTLLYGVQTPRHGHFARPLSFSYDRLFPYSITGMVLQQAPATMNTWRVVVLGGASPARVQRDKTTFRLCLPCLLLASDGKELESTDPIPRLSYVKPKVAQRWFDVGVYYGSDCVVCNAAASVQCPLLLILLGSGLAVKRTPRLPARLQSVDNSERHWRRGSKTTAWPPGPDKAPRRGAHVGTTTDIGQ